MHYVIIAPDHPAEFYKLKHYSCMSLQNVSNFKNRPKTHAATFWTFILEHEELGKQAVLWQTETGRYTCEATAS